MSIRQTPGSRSSPSQHRLGRSQRLEHDVDHVEARLVGALHDVLGARHGRRADVDLGLEADPLMPSGADPVLLSITNSCGITWITSRSIGIATALAASITRRTSPSGHLVVLHRDDAVRVEAADDRRDAGVDRRDLAVAHQLRFFDGVLDRVDGASMSTTTPRRSPFDGCVPMPTTSTPSSVRSATTRRSWSFRCPVRRSGLPCEPSSHPLGGPRLSPGGPRGRCRAPTPLALPGASAPGAPRDPVRRDEGDEQHAAPRSGDRSRASRRARIAAGDALAGARASGRDRRRRARCARARRRRASGHARSILAVERELRSC